MKTHLYNINKLKYYTAAIIKCNILLFVVIGTYLYFILK